MKRLSSLTFLVALFLISCTSDRRSTSTSVAESTPIEIKMPTLTIAPTPENWKLENYLIAFKDMSILLDNEIWAVGDPGLIVHDQLEFTYPKDLKNIINYPGIGSLVAVDFISPNDGWVASSAGEILHWNGNEFVVVIPGNSDAYHVFEDIEFADTDSGWAVGCLDSAAQNSSGSSGDIPVMLQWNGAEWDDISLLNDLSVNDCLYSIDVISENDVWILGDNYKDGAIVLHWNGLAWQRISVPELMHGRNMISASSDTNVWVTADKGNTGSNTYYWNGNIWQQMELPASPFISFPSSKRSPEILAIASDDVWAGGNGIFHWDGKEWKDMAYDARYGYIVDIEKAPDGTIWALTVRGSLIKLNYEQK